MIAITIALILLAAACLVAGVFVVRFRPHCNTSFLEIAPRYRSFFRQLGVRDMADFLALAGQTPHIVSGHPDRNVARLTFAAGGQQWSAFLKCEHHVRWQTRVGNALAGFGLVSRSLREVRILQALQREGLPGPEWLAAGEDGSGRAFLLVRAAAGMELRAVLATEKDPRQRRVIARRLGDALARLHTAGFHHPDLYAQHVFLDRPSDSICLLDWQRACLRRKLSWRQRRRGLAILHATLDDSLATEEERLLCLRRYWRNSCAFGVSWQMMVRGVESKSRRLLARRHIREKRQPPAPSQAWICLEGEALCVTPTLQAHCGERMADYLPVCGEEKSVNPSMRQRWPALPDAARALLVLRNQPARRSAESPEQRQAALLLRLQRHGVAAPLVLALGQRRAAEGRVESFLLTEPLSDTCSLEAWLAYRTRRRMGPRALERRGTVLRQAGALLRRLHDASCYLHIGYAGCGFAVRQADGQSSVVLDRAEHVIALRHRHSRRESRDLRQMLQMLRSAGCNRSDWDRFRTGYFGENPKFEIRNPKEIQKPKSEIANKPTRDFGVSGFFYYGLKFLSDFGFRISDFSQGGCDSIWRRLLFGVRRWRQRPDWPHFAGENWPDHIMDTVVTDRFHAKQGRSTGRWIVTNAAEVCDQKRRLSVYLKRHYELPWWRGWLATLWPRRNWSPAWQEWRHLEWAQRQGLPVPRAVAVAEYIGPWGKLRSFLAVEELTGMLSLHEAIPLAALRQDARSFRKWKHGLAAELARLTRMLHDRRCFHKDLYLCHFFIAAEDTHGEPADGWSGRLHLIDLHRLSYQPLTWRLGQTKDLAELLYSSGILGVDARDRLVFWRAYRGDGPHRPRCPWLRRLILYRWRRYCRHNARGKSEPEALAKSLR